MNPTNPPDILTQLSHKMIQQAIGDNFDPFMLQWEQQHPGVQGRSCFYYAVMTTPHHAVLFDNLGKGGMCDLSFEEICAVWPIEQLLESQGIEESDFNAKSDLPDNPIPKGIEVHYDLDDRDFKGIDINTLVEPDKFVSFISLSELLKKDPHIFINIAGRVLAPENVENFFINSTKRIEDLSSRNWINEELNLDVSLQEIQLPNKAYHVNATVLQEALFKLAPSKSGEISNLLEAYKDSGENLLMDLEKILELRNKSLEFQKQFKSQVIMNKTPLNKPRFR